MARRKIIKIDYVAESMFILDSLDEVNLNKFKKVKLGFQKDSHQKYTTAFPRMSIKVQGIEYQMLFDTGASSTLTSEAKNKYRVNRMWLVLLLLQLVFLIIGNQQSRLDCYRES